MQICIKECSNIKLLVGIFLHLLTKMLEKTVFRHPHTNIDNIENTSRALRMSLLIDNWCC